MPMGDRERHRVLTSAGWINKAEVGGVGKRRQNVTSGHDEGLDRLTVDEPLNVPSELSAVFSCGGRGICLVRLFNHRGLHRRIHGGRWRAPDEDTGVLLTVVAAVRI